MKLPGNLGVGKLLKTPPALTLVLIVALSGSEGGWVGEWTKHPIDLFSPD